MSGHSGSVRVLVPAPDGRRLVSASADGSMRLWRCSDGACAAAFEGHRAPVRTAALSADGALLASGSQTGSVRLWDVASGSCLHALQGHTGAVNALAFADNRALLYTGAQDGTVRVWRIAAAPLGGGDGGSGGGGGVRSCLGWLGALQREQLNAAQNTLEQVFGIVGSVGPLPLGPNSRPRRGAAQLPGRLQGSANAAIRPS